MRGGLGRGTKGVGGGVGSGVGGGVGGGRGRNFPETITTIVSKTMLGIHHDHEHPSTQTINKI